VKESIFLTVEECLRLHEELIRRFGGSAGLRDPGLLESALARPRSGYYQTLFEQAAALMQSLAMNHCFVDGNKRMAMGCAFIFLDWNGFEINASAEAAENFLLKKVILGKADVAEIAGWLEAHAAALSHGKTGEKPATRPKKSRGRPAKGGR
jgi:death-on-curing protein